MAKKLADGGWWYVEQADGSDLALMRFRWWHPLFWWHALRRRHPHG